MKKERFAFFVLILFLIVFAASCDRPGSGSKREIESANEFLAFIKEGKLKDAALMFNQPSHYTEDELRKEADEIEAWFGTVFKHLGKLTEYSETDKIGTDGNHYYFSIAGGDIPYWDNFSGYSKRNLFKVSLTEIGEAFVAVETCGIDEGWEIKLMMLYVPMSDSNRKIIESLFEDLKFLEEKMGGQGDRQRIY